MRLLFIHMAVAFICIYKVSEVKSGDFNNDQIEGAFTADNYKREIMKLAKTHFNLSLKYLYTGIGFANQMASRPGLAKHLRELSNSHWEAAMDTVKKYIERGGLASDIISKGAFKFEGSNELEMTKSETLDTSDEYITTLNSLYDDSKQLSVTLNNIHKMTTQAKNGDYDADWSHFAEEKLEVETKRTRELLSDVTTLQQMLSSPLAISMFDSNY